MIHLYVLSVVTLFMSGISLAAPLLDEKLPWPKLLDRSVLAMPMTALILGLITFVVGFLQLLFVPLGGIAVLGNLFPALGGIIAGFTLCLTYYQSRTSVVSESLEKIASVFVGNRDVIGVLLLLIALLHFVFPAVILL